MARKLARMHALEMPIEKSSMCAIETSKCMYGKFLSNSKASVIAKVLPKDIVLATEVLEFDFDEQLQWLAAVYANVEHKQVFCHQDLHLSNVLVKLNQMRDQHDINDNDVIIIDYDVCCYNDRGTDLGSHFFHRAFDHSKRNMVLGDGAATEDEKRFFVNEYHQELQRIAANCGKRLDQKMDTIEQITLECDFFEMAMCMVTAAWLLCFRDPSDDKYELWVRKVMHE